MFLGNKRKILCAVDRKGVPSPGLTPPLSAAPVEGRVTPATGPQGTWGALRQGGGTAAALSPFTLGWPGREDASLEGNSGELCDGAGGGWR